MQIETVVTADLLNNLFDNCYIIYGIGTLEWQVCWNTVRHVFETLGFFTEASRP